MPATALWCLTLECFPRLWQTKGFPSLISNPGECLSTLWTTQLCWIQGQAVILFQPFSNNSRQQRLAGYHGASKEDRESSLGAWDPTTGSGEWFKLQQAGACELGANRDPAEGPRELSLLAPHKKSLYFSECLTNWERLLRNRVAT